jgi:ribonuclease T1
MGVIGVLIALPLFLMAVGIGQQWSHAATSSAPVAQAPSRSGCRPPSPATPGVGESKLPLRALCDLPTEVAHEWELIASGHQLDHPSRDGIVFSNAGRQLPREKSGYYHEYTVTIPAATTRGARRLITGQGHELYYTADHYRTFVLVDPTAN